MASTQLLIIGWFTGSRPIRGFSLPAAAALTASMACPRSGRRHRGTLGRPSPNTAIISRMHLVHAAAEGDDEVALGLLSSQSQQVGGLGSAGLPYLPTISSASRPTC